MVVDVVMEADDIEIVGRIEIARDNITKLD